MYLPGLHPGQTLPSFFSPLAHHIETMFSSGKPPYPVERTLLTGGILDAALQSRIEHHQPVATPELAAIDYAAPADSGYIRSSLTNPAPNRL